MTPSPATLRRGNGRLRWKGMPFHPKATCDRTCDAKASHLAKEQSNLRPLPRKAAGVQAKMRIDGFTLIELLAALMIVFVLLGLILPATHSLRQAARRRQAATEAGSLLKAVYDYRSAYGKWPLQTQDAHDTTHTNSADIIYALTDCPVGNPRQIHFIGIPSRDLTENKEMVDPWNRSYIFAFDDNGDGHVKIDAAKFPWTPTTPVISNVSAVVLSLGPNPQKEDDRIWAW